MTQQEINEQISRLTEERRSLESNLQQGDYKIIKCAEAQSVGEELPYDAEALHQQRQAWRDRINAIEDEIAELEAMEPEDETPAAEAEE